MFVAYVRDIDFYLTFNVANVKQTAAVFRNEAIYLGDLSIQLHQATS